MKGTWMQSEIMKWKELCETTEDVHESVFYCKIKKSRDLHEILKARKKKRILLQQSGFQRWKERSGRKGVVNSPPKW